MRALLVIVLSSLAPWPAAAESVYRCTDNGKTSFTQQPTGPHCQPMDIRPEPVDLDEVARKQQEMQDWNRRLEAQARQSVAREAATARQRQRSEFSALGRGDARSDTLSGRRSHGYRRGRRGGGIAPQDLPPEP